MNASADGVRKDVLCTAAIFGDKGVIRSLMQGRDSLEKCKELKLRTKGIMALALKKLLLLFECLIDEVICSQELVLQKQTRTLFDEGITDSDSREQALRNNLVEESLALERRIVQVLSNSTDMIVNLITCPFAREDPRARTCLQALCLSMTRIHDFRNMRCLHALTRLKINFDEKMKVKILPLIHKSIMILCNNQLPQQKPTQAPPEELLAMFPTEMKPLSKFFVSGLDPSRIVGASRLAVTRDNQMHVGFLFYAVFTGNGIWLFSFPHSHANLLQDFLYWQGTWHVLKILPTLPLRNQGNLSLTHACHSTMLLWKDVESIISCKNHHTFVSLTVKTSFEDRHRPGQKCCFKFLGPSDVFWVNRFYRHVDRDAAGVQPRAPPTKPTPGEARREQQTASAQRLTPHRPAASPGHSQTIPPLPTSKPPAAPSNH